jgi:hypothetical protein
VTQGIQGTSYRNIGREVESKDYVKKKTKLHNVCSMEELKR